MARRSINISVGAEETREEREEKREFIANVYGECVRMCRRISETPPSPWFYECLDGCYEIGEYMKENLLERKERSQ